MATVMLRTKAGAAHDKSVREGSKPASPYKHIILLSGTPVTNIPDILNLATWNAADELHRFTRHDDENSEFPLTESGETWSRFEPSLTENQGNGHISAIAIAMDDGTLWAYAPYLPEHGGLTKTAAFTWAFDLLIVESTGEATALQFAYSPLDYRAIRDRLIAEINISKSDLLKEIFCAGLKSPPFGVPYDCSGALDLTATDITGIAAPTF